MKTILILSFVVAVFSSCNMNPNKEARIQELETKIEAAIEKTDALEARLKIVEAANKELKLRFLELKKKP